MKLNRDARPGRQEVDSTHPVQQGTRGVRGTRFLNHLDLLRNKMMKEKIQRKNALLTVFLSTCRRFGRHPDRTARPNRGTGRKQPSRQRDRL